MRPPERLLDYREYPVLFVDDEPENLRVFELAFRREFRVATARSGEEALRLLHEMPAAVVLSDQRMEGISGVDLLTRVREIDPKTLRILVTAYGDAETLREAINSGSIFRYVPKPWQPEEMRLTLRNAIEIYALDREREELVRELGVLNRVARVLSGELETRPLLELLLRTITEELGYDGATLLCFDAKREQLRVTACAPSGSEATARLQELSIRCAEARDFVARLDAGQIQGWSSEDMLDLPSAVQRLATEIAAEEALVIPLLGKHGALAALVVDNRRGGVGFSSADRTLLSGLASQASISLQNAQMVEELRDFRRRISERDRLAATMTVAAGVCEELAAGLATLEQALGRDAQAALRLRRAREALAALAVLVREPGEAGEAVDVAELVGQLPNTLAEELEQQQARLELEVEPPLPKLLIPRAALAECLARLVSVALARAPRPACVTLRARPLPEERGVELELTHRGPGYRPEEIEALAHPVPGLERARTPEVLAWLLIQQVVAAQGGTLEVGSACAETSSYRLQLPAQPGERAVSPEAPPPVDPSRGQ